MMRSLLLMLSVTLGAFSSNALMAAENSAILSQHQAHHGNQDALMTAGVVENIDKDAAKLTIKHEELKSLAMPAMTMVFQVKEPSVLDQVKIGDHVKFVAESVDSKLAITKLIIKNNPYSCQHGV